MIGPVCLAKMKQRRPQDGARGLLDHREIAKIVSFLCSTDERAVCRIWLDCDDASRWSDGFRSDCRIETYVRADVDDTEAWSQDFLEQSEVISLVAAKGEISRDDCVISIQRQGDTAYLNFFRDEETNSLVSECTNRRWLE
jgi:hypothetical protein